MHTSVECSAYPVVIARVFCAVPLLNEVGFNLVMMLLYLLPVMITWITRKSMYRVVGEDAIARLCSQSRKIALIPHDENYRPLALSLGGSLFASFFEPNDRRAWISHISTPIR